MSLTRIRLLACGIVVVGCAGVARSAPPTTATQQFVDAHPGTKARVNDGELAAIWGAPMARNENPPIDTNEFVKNFLHTNDSALGVDGLALWEEGLVPEVFPRIEIRNGRQAVYTYKQACDALRVYGHFVTTLVLLADGTEPDRIVYVSTRLLECPAPALPAGSVSAGDAIGIVGADPTYAHLTLATEAEAEEVLHRAPNETVHRVWRFHGSDDDEAYIFFVDTTSGAIVEALDSLLRGSEIITGRVTGYTTPCCHPGQPEYPDCCPPGDPDCCSCGPTDPNYPQCAYACCGGHSVPDGSPPFYDDSYPVAHEMSTVRVIWSQDGGGIEYANESGDYQISGLDPVPPAPEVQVYSILYGDWARITLQDTVTPSETPIRAPWDQPASVIPSSPLPGTVQPLTFNPLPAAANPPDPQDPAHWPSLVDTAQVSGFVYVHKAHDWFNDLPGWTDLVTPIDTEIEVKVVYRDIIEHCDASYSTGRPDHLLTMFLSPDSCSASHPSVVGHEMGHFVVDQVSPFEFTDPTRIFHEGAADTFAGFMLDTECMFFELTTPDDCTRNLDTPDRQFGDSGTLHTVSLAFSGAFWDLRRELLHCQGGETACPRATCSGTRPPVRRRPGAACP